MSAKPWGTTTGDRTHKTLEYGTSVVDPNTLNLDPDPECWPNLNPDPGLCYKF